MKIKFKRGKKEEKPQTTDAPTEKKGRFSKFKLKRGKKEEELESVTVIEPEVIKDVPQETADHPGLHKIEDITEIQEESMPGEFESQELETQEIQTEEIEAQELEEFQEEVEEIEESPRKKSKGMKKIIIILPVIIAAFLGVWMMGFIPSNDFLPESPIGDQMSADDGQQTSETSIEELESRIDSLQSKINELSALSTEGRQGPQGETGSKGEQGVPGLQGQKGDPGVSLIPIAFGTGEQSIRITGTTYVGSNTNYWEYNAVKILMPVNGIFKNLKVVVDRDPGIPIRITLLKNGFDTAISCRLDGSSVCSDKNNSVSVSAGDTIAIKLDKLVVEDSINFHLKAGVLLQSE